MGPLGSDDPKFTELATQAMEIYWRDVIDILRPVAASLPTTNLLDKLLTADNPGLAAMAPSGTIPACSSSPPQGQK
jgi:hypothetical protein